MRQGYLWTVETDLCLCSVQCRGETHHYPACKYWSTGPKCMYYFKMFRPVIRVLMIVITKVSSLCVCLFRACGHQINKTDRCWRYEGRPGVLMELRAALGMVGSGLCRGSSRAVCHKDLSCVVMKTILLKPSHAWEPRVYRDKDKNETFGQRQWDQTYCIVQMKGYQGSNLPLMRIFGLSCVGVTSLSMFLLVHV